MIKVNEEFSFDKDLHNWILYKTTETEKGESIKKSYPGSLAQLLNKILEDTDYDASSVEELRLQVKIAQEQNREIGTKITNLMVNKARGSIEVLQDFRAEIKRDFPDVYDHFDTGILEGLNMAIKKLAGEL